jgi:DNA invertase Pin-like site-specific DNA recombinase
MPKHVALYVRCSTEEQTTENQIRELRVVAERHGWIVSDVFDDAGISGSAAHEDRPAMKRLLRAVARCEVRGGYGGGLVGRSAWPQPARSAGFPG